MKRLSYLFLALSLCLPSVAAAQDGLSVAIGTKTEAALPIQKVFFNPKRNGREDNRNERERDRNYSPSDRGGNNWRDDDPFEDRRDNRINQAMSIASSRGRVLDAGPMGGSLFWVRVATDKGRVDLIVDTATGRIVGER